MEYLLIGALAVVIAGSLVLSLKQGCGSTTRTLDGDSPYICTECNEQFVPDKDKRPPVGMMVGGPGHAMPIDCPRCEKKACALPMRKCPKPECAKYFLSPTIKYDYDMNKEGEVPEDHPAEICTHCGTDVAQWLHDHRPKRKRRK